VVEDVKRRTEGRAMSLITSDEHRPYKEAILQAYGVEATTTPSGLPVRAPRKEAPPSLCYATVHKVRRLGRQGRLVLHLWTHQTDSLQGLGGQVTDRSGDVRGIDPLQEMKGGVTYTG